MILINSSSKNALKIFQPFLPIYVPVGIGCILGAAMRQGIKAYFVDEQVEDNILGLAAEYVKGMQKPYIFGFSVLTLSFKNAIIVSRELKRLYPDSIIVFGGAHPSALPEESLSYGHVDIVIRGEGERALLELYKHIKEGKDFTHLGSISYKKNNEIINNALTPIIEDIDSFPPFPYHLFTSKQYDLGFVVSSRGCPYKCIFCSNRITTGRKYRHYSSERIVSELETLNDKYKKNFILFLDDNFCVSKDRINNLIDLIKIKGLHRKMTFSFQARGDNVDYELLRDLFSAGFRSVFFGLETASERIMKVIKKEESVADCVRAVRMAKKIGFHVSATFIYGLPGESHSDRMNCVNLSNELELDMVRYNNATPYPGTELYEFAKKSGCLKVEGLYENFVSVSTFIENPFKKTPFSYVPQGASEAEIRRDILFSYFNFYLNLSRLKKIFAKPKQGAGWFNAGSDPLKIFKKLPGLFILGFMLFFKFCQLFYYMVIKKETATSLKSFFKVFSRNGI
mgnify:CR=1 FL=1